MRREVTTTVRVKLHSLTERKARLVEREYTAFQDAVHGDDDANLYSATKQQAGKVRSNKNPRADTDQPVVLRNDCITIEHDEDTVLSSWWFKLPVYNPEKEHGDSVWVPVRVPEKDTHLFTDECIRDSELVQRDGEWYVHLVCKRSVAVADAYDDVLAVDMGAKWIAVSTLLSDRDTTFHGAEVRRVREHYKQLRKSIGKRKVRSGAKVMERLGDKESRTVEHELYQVANELIARAQERNAVIVFGDMTGLRVDNDEGRYVNDKTHKMPYAKMANILTYKAHLDGRECISVKEHNTSVTCWRCGSKNTSREVQGRLECHDCGLDDNADKNGASNIGQRAVGKDITSPLSTAGAVVAQPETQVVLEGTSGEMEPANSPEDVGLTLSEGSPRL
ncbi:IS200/IS605 family element transposase accessory protein TnpB [Halorubrum salinarum]|uniref:IS200/IS605 family element transposase accessory protein TnpB n=2 Tax=Halorubrum TaxID=56688 RepID=A0A7D4CNM9_9EURY|nr:RNA-guided endonuclease TnpB family protein [Halorubrum salinarum]QKG93841.1 IS200/IS605 family element transposase accessory protein TnpB [Halorubrum salinarum]